jgi:hypothetical protein
MWFMLYSLCQIGTSLSRTGKAKSNINSMSDYSARLVARPVPMVNRSNGSSLNGLFQQVENPKFGYVDPGCL